MIEKYQIPKYKEFISGFKVPDLKSGHTAQVVDLYFELAYYQMLDLSETCTAFFKERDPNHDTVLHYLHKAWSHAYAMYALLRTSLDASRLLKKLVAPGLATDSYYLPRIRSIVNIANDIVKHPLFKADGISTGAEPRALSLNGEIDIVIASVGGEVKMAQLDPMKDFETVRDYIDHIGEGLKSRYGKPL